jgi:hypothetical protein
VIRFESLAFWTAGTVRNWPYSHTCTEGPEVDRLTTGRRHVRAGSVSVTELITKQAASPQSILDRRDEDRPSAVTIERLAVPEAPTSPTSHRRASARGVQVIKATSLGVATIVLCGAVGIASTIAHQRQEHRAPTIGPAERISGEQALLPDELDRSLTDRDAPVASSKPAPSPATRTSSTVAGPPAPRPADPPPATKTPTATPPVSDVDLVRKFYEFLPREPATAFDLISPSLLHSTLGRFLRSWSLVRDVDVLGLTERADGVLAVIRMRLADGGHLQLQQLLTVADAPRRIVAVELLSAQRN